MRRGENIQLALLLADIFGGEVDFNSDLQLGDRVSALFDRVVRDGDAGEYGDSRRCGAPERRQPHRRHPIR